jgi:hypothetical protein
VESLSGFAIRVIDAGLIKLVWKFSPLQFFWRHWRRSDINSLNIWWKSPVKPGNPARFFVARFLMTDSTSLAWPLVYSDFLFLHDSVMEGYMFPGICPFFLNCPICWHIINHSSFLWSFTF